MLRLLTVLTHLSFVLCWLQSATPHSHRRKKSTFDVGQRLLGMATVSNDELISVDTTTSNEVRILGVCGGIGSGKSTACKVLVSELKCLAHIDSDSIAHTVYEPNSSAIIDIVNEFGSEVLSITGELDRKKLGSIVFTDINAMKKLEGIVWPHVKTKILQQIDTLKAECSSMENSISIVPIIIVEAAVLLDAGWNDFLDGIWVVTAAEDVATRRLQENRNLTAEEATKRILAQSSRRGIGSVQNEVDDGLVTAVIHNDGTLDDLKTYLLEKINDPNAWYQQR